MYVTADQIAAANKTNLDAVQNLATKSFAGVEKLVELNMAAAKAVITESFAHAQNLLAAKDAQALMALQTSLFAPTAEKAVSYGRHVYGILVEASAEVTKLAEGKAAEAQKSFNQVVENVAKNAPAGTESAVTVLKSALASSQSAMESAQSAAKQALAMAESNISAVTEQALTAAAKVGQKA
ncbi:TIGR01841 family phasin [Rhodoferax sp.]|uniref:TIGR01841 family phasin n=1 Tax=Rhodoferax sp. TaxID=50421 RepID=UPI00261FE3DB|nr:TIGR01841 family phasin [Rhodoferax sp.]MDD2809337.1 TIGR01841 family phasin [Rhodoferax sp.]MDD4942787.1 TIGR01841 family phasin [Rhodoferax sp.]